MNAKGNTELVLTGPLPVAIEVTTTAAQWAGQRDTLSLLTAAECDELIAALGEIA